MLVHHGSDNQSNMKEMASAVESDIMKSSCHIQHLPMSLVENINDVL